MSMSNLIVQPETAYLMTDSGYYGTDGRVLGFGPKSIVFEEQLIAISAVGTASLHLVVDHLRKDWRTCGQEKFIADIIPAVRKAYDANGLDPVKNWCRFFIACYSRRLDRAIGLSFFTNPDDGAKDQKPWKLYPASLVFAPLVAPYAELKPVYGEQTFDPFTASMPLIEAQRQHTHYAEGVGCRVAGAIDLVSVSQDGIRVDTIHEFADKVGEPVDLIGGETPSN